VKRATCDMIYLYAVTDQPELPVPAEPGLEGTSLISVTHQDMCGGTRQLWKP